VAACQELLTWKRSEIAEIRNHKPTLGAGKNPRLQKQRWRMMGKNPQPFKMVKKI
jgi:hypothetical protein